MSVLNRRVIKLERRLAPKFRRVNPSPLIVCGPDETIEAAISRIHGEAGLPYRAPEDGPHLILQAVRPLFTARQPTQRRQGTE
jgi:hypothetical protein